MGKKTKQKQLEILAREQKYQQIIQKGNISKNSLTVLQNIYEHKLGHSDFPQTNPFYTISLHLNRHINEKRIRERRAFYELLSTLIKNRAEKMFSDERLVSALETISHYRGRFIRELSDWRMPCHNPYRSFGHLIRYLFAEYEVATFMDNAFYSGNSVHIDWYLLVAAGKSLRKCAQLPIPLSAKGIHLFLNAPAKYKIGEALRYAQVLSLGGDEKLVAHLLATPLANPVTNEAFWETVIRFFIQNPMLDPVHIAPIIDCIKHKKFANINPEMPNFEMKGRTPASILRMVEDWHNQLNWAQKGRIGKNENEFWIKFNIPDFVHFEGKEIQGMTTENGEPVYEKTYRIIQLMSAKELQKEGQTMRHCVASYAQSCKMGNTSIWSFTLKTIDKLWEEKHLLTIELNKMRTIVQIRGKHNARADEKEMRIIQKWATQERLQLSRWI